MCRKADTLLTISSNDYGVTLIVRWLWYALYDDRRTMCMTTAVRAVDGRHTTIMIALSC